MGKAYEKGSAKIKVEGYPCVHLTSVTAHCPVRREGGPNPIDSPYRCVPKTAASGIIGPLSIVEYGSTSVRIKSCCYNSLRLG